ncbi:DNA mismatch repair endonuclease MutL [Chloroflexota bacterium]
MPIKILSKETIAQIAAGEVVERPASVVKELVENALDAGSSRIEVEVRGGGVSLMRITDNGSGIHAGEVALAFERHATSKIGGPGDLQRIGSLGFRGEALPSIVAVARVEVLTCTGEAAAGTLLNLEGGVAGSQQSRARARGTTITVRDLFHRVPARLKFLKTAPTENSHIANVASQYALAFPEVGFTLSVDGRVTLRTAGRGKLIDSVIDVYGAAVAGKMLAVNSPDEGWQDGRDETAIRVAGMVGSPEVGRAGRGYLSFFVNRRWVTSRLLARAVEEAYHGLLMVGKHPVAVVNIFLPPDEVDVNIHPAKSEVKFQREQDVFRAVQRVVRQALVAQMPVPKVGEPVPAYVSPPAPKLELRLATDSAGRINSLFEAATPLALSLPVLRVVGQVLQSYIVAEGPDGIYVIDQHAAHERIRFEQVIEQKSRREIEVQGLLEPATFEVSPRQDEMLQSCGEELADFGFSLEPFGARTYLVRAVPALVGREGWAEMLRELLDALSGEVRSNWSEKILASVACHGAVRGGQALTDDEMRELVRNLERASTPHTCPHGRPTMIHLSLKQLEKEFGRS